MCTVTKVSEGPHSPVLACSDPKVVGKRFSPDATMGGSQVGKHLSEGVFSSNTRIIEHPPP